jgi:hypothetical protein
MQQQTNGSGNIGNIGEIKGNTLLVTVPENQWNRIESAVIQGEELITEREVLEEFHISKKTLCNYIWSGKIPENYYTVCFNGEKRFYNKKLLGLEK